MSCAHPFAARRFVFSRRQQPDRIGWWNAYRCACGELVTTWSMEPTDYSERLAMLQARRLLNRAVRWGRIVRPAACDNCGDACTPDGHHDDYARPYAVRWLCRRCHHRADIARRERERKIAA